MSATAIILEPEAGEFIWFGAGLFTFKVTSEQSGGVFMLTEVTMSRGKTTPLHVHPEHDETTYLVDGELLFNVDGMEQTARAGSVAAVPRGTPHALLVTSESARLITFVTPGPPRAAPLRPKGRLSTCRASSQLQSGPASWMCSVLLHSIASPNRRCDRRAERTNRAGFSRASSPTRCRLPSRAGQ